MRVLLVLAAFLVCLAGADEVIRCDFGIVGGGSAGTFAAVTLIDLNYTVCLLESQPQIGGHCNTLRFPGGYIDLGVDTIDNTTWDASKGFGSWSVNSEAYIQRFMPAGTLIPIDLTAGGSTNYIVDMQHGIGPVPFPPPSPAQLLLQEEAIGTLIYILSAKYPWIQDASSWPDNFTAELLQPFNITIVQYGLQPIADSIMEILLEVSGLGSPEDLTTLWALEQLNLADTELFLPGTKGASFAIAGGCGTFYENVQAWLGNSVYVGATIKDVDRPEQEDCDSYRRDIDAGTDRGRDDSRYYGIRISADVAGYRHRQKFAVHNLILALPQTLENLAFLDLDDVETAVYSQVQTRAYFAFEAAMSGPIASTSFNILNFDLFRPSKYLYPVLPSVTAVRHEDPASPFVAGWAESDNSSITDDEMMAVIVDRISRIPHVLLTNITVTALIRHVYQPFVPVASLAATPHFFAQIAAKEGHRNTFDIGALLTGQAVSTKAWEFAKRLITQFFPPRPNGPHWNVPSW